jgi:hypothetical protein
MRTLKPDYPLVIDWNDPINKGLFDCVLLGPGIRPVNMRNGQLGAVSGAPVATINRDGRAITTSAGNWPGITQHGLAANVCPTQAFTARVVLMPTAWQQSVANCVFGKDDAANFRQFHMFCNNSGNVDYYVPWGSSSNSFIQPTTPIPLGLPLNVVSDVVWTRSEVVNCTNTFYRDGVNKGTYSDSLNNNSAQQITNPIYFGHDGINGTTYDVAADFLLWQLWTRRLRDDEVARLGQNRYAGLIPAPRPVRRAYYAQAAAAATILQRRTLGQRVGSRQAA